MKHQHKQLRRTRMLLVTVMATVMLFTCTGGPVNAWWQPKNLGDLARKLARDLPSDTAKGTLYFRQNSFENAITHEIPKLSIYLYNYVRSATSAAGFTHVTSMDDADFLLTGEFSKLEDKVSFFFSYEHRKELGKSRTLEYTMDEKNLPQDAFAETMETKALKLTSSLMQSPENFRHVMKGKHLLVFVNPIVHSTYKYSSDFSEDFLSKMKHNFVQGDIIRIVEPKPVRKRGTRSLAMKAKRVTSLDASDAAFAGADAVMEGRYRVGEDVVTVDITIKDLNGKVISSAQEQVPKAIIPVSIENPQAEHTAQTADISSEIGGNMVKVSLDRGSSYQTYYEGDTAVILVQVAQPLFVYVYAINPKNEVSLLYPLDEPSSIPLQPKTLMTIPPENADWELEIVPPFGIENIKVFASDKPLPVPQLSGRVRSLRDESETRSLARKKIQKELSTKTTINPTDLVDFYKGAATRSNAVLYEDSVFMKSEAHP